MTTIKIKPLSVNEAWKGRRYKTDKYKNYETKLLCMLPPTMLIPDEIEINIEFGFSNILSDIDNPVKCFVDVLQKKYGFNDSQIWKMNLDKTKVIKGNDYIKFEIKDFLRDLN